MFDTSKIEVLSCVPMLYELGLSCCRDVLEERYGAEMLADVKQRNGWDGKLGAICLGAEWSIAGGVRTHVRVCGTKLRCELCAGPRSCRAPG
jgi:hypothetical protein